MTSDRVRKRVVVQGRVQGVWFRGATEEHARALGVAGWVRNRADGAVEAVFEGARDAVEAALAFCRRGPPAARVDRVDVADEPPEGLAGFAIVRSASR
jgi:acylphosphatase